MSRPKPPRRYLALFDKYHLVLVKHAYNKHHKFSLRRPDGETVKLIAPSSVSDHRGLSNLEATLRKLIQ